MKRPFVGSCAVLLALLCTGCGSGPEAPSTPQGLEEDLIVGVVQDFFQALEAREKVRLERVLHEDATLTRIDARGEERSVSRSSGSDWISAVSVPGPPLIERMEGAQVEVAENLAQLWAYYTFQIGDSLSHCGYDAFQLVKTGPEGWRILGVTYTIETCP